MEERRKAIREFAEKFYKQVKKKEESKESLAESLRKVSQYFKLDFKEKSYEEVLENILGSSEEENEKIFSREWFTVLIGEFCDPSIRFSVKGIRDSFKRDLLSSFHFPFTQENLKASFEEHFNFLNDKNMENLINEVRRGISKKEKYSRINLMLAVKRDVIGPVKVIPQLFLSYYTQFFSAGLLYVVPPVKGRGSEAAIEILNYYHTSSKLKFLHEILYLREMMKDLKYNSSDLLSYFLLSKELENILRRRK